MSTPEPDFFKRERYFLPEQWIIDKSSYHYMTYFGSVALILNMLPNPPRKILDAGCGPGRLTHELVKRNYEAAGFDYSPRAIDYARLLVPNAKFCVLDLTRKDDFIVFDRGFNVIILREVLEHIDPLYHDQILAYFHTILVDDGILILTVPTKRVPRNPLKHYVHFNEDEVVALLESHDFRVEDVVGNIRYGLLYRLLFDSKLASAFYSLLAPTVLKILSGKIYTLFFNRCPPSKCGRLIIKAKKGSA